MIKSVLVAVAAVFLAFPAWAGDIEISGAFMRAPPKGAPAGGAFLTIKNNGSQDDRLLSAQANISKTVELHTHVVDGNVMRMRQVESIAVPAGGTAELKPGGDHIMFIGLEKAPQEGDTVPVTLTFEKAGAISISVPVVAVGAMSMPMKMDGAPMK